MREKIDAFVREVVSGRPRYGNALRQITEMIAACTEPGRVLLVVVSSRAHAQWYVEQIMERTSGPTSPRSEKTGDGFDLTFRNGSAIHVHMSRTAKRLERDQAGG